MQQFRFSMLVLMLLLLILSMGNTQDQKVDRRVWSLYYWQKMAKAGLVEVTKPGPVPEAEFTGSRIRALTVRFDDSPDVPVTTLTSTTQSENSIFVNPSNPNKVLNSNNSTSNPVSVIYGTSGFVTNDGGLTWTGQIQGTGGSNSGDPSTSIDLNGNYYVGYIAADGGQGVAHSSDEGGTWTHVQVAPGPSGFNDLLDKNHMWVDNSPSSPYQGNLYSAWTRFEAGSPNDAEIEISRSTDGGLTWSPPIAVSTAVNAGSHNQGVNIATGSNGEVYVIWAIYDSFPADENAIGFAKSLDGGVTFQTATRIITNIRGIRNSETSKNQRVASFPVMDVDISGGPRDGWIYVTWTNIGTPGINTGSDIDNYFSRSTDGGQSWSTPVKINQDPSGLGNEHYFPWLACDAETGNISVVFYDDRNVGSSQCEVFVANSVDGGNNWEDFKVSDVSFTPSPIPGLASGYFGDYLGIASRGGQVYPCWTDNRTGSALTYVSPFSLADPLDPNPPDDVMAYSDYTTPNSISLSWLDPTSLANGDTLLPSDFQIMIKRDTVLIDSVNGGVGQYADSGLNDGQQYNYALYTKIILNDSTSLEVRKSWIAGGAQQPNPPSNFYITQADSVNLMMHWTNPNKNIDATPMDDFAGINLYEDGSMVMNYTRTTSDTGLVDSASYHPPSGTHSYYVSAYDNESPSNESDPSNSSYSPLGIPFLDEFATTPEPNPAFWINTNGEVTGESVNPPSPPNALALDGYPNGGDLVELLPVDLSGQAGQGMIVSYWYQPQGTGNDPETGDSLALEFKNDLGQWKTIRSYPGTTVQPFINEIVSIDGENPGSGATFFHPAFQLRFRNLGTASTTSHFDHWFVDDLFLGLPSNTPSMAVSTTALSDTLLIGETNILHFDVLNDQPLPSSLNFTISENPAADWISVSPVNGTVASNQSMTIDVMLDAGLVAAGSYTTDLVISGNDTANVEDTITVNLEANEAPVISVTPDSLSFIVPPGQQDSTTFTINNFGGGPLEILSIEDEEVNTLDWKPSYIQPQKPTVYYAKGEAEPSFGEVTDGAGGPDPFGYKWIDSDEPGGPTYQYTDISQTGTVVNLLPTGTYDPKDEGMATLTLPFDVKYYGLNFNQIQVNSNGVILFDLSFFDNLFTNQQIPNTAVPQGIVAPFWDDLDGRANGEIYQQQVGNSYIVQWHNWGHFPSGTENMIFQVVFFKNSSTILFVYEHIVDDAGATFGIENMDGTIGLQIGYNQQYAHDQLLVKFSKGAEWISETPLSGTVPPGGSMDIKVKADAANLSPGSYDAKIIIDSNDPVNGQIKLPAVSLNIPSGSGLQVIPDTMAFDTTYVGMTSSEELLVKNLGSSAITVDTISCSNSYFTVDTTNFTVPPLGNVLIHINFSPVSVCDTSGVISISSNDPVNPIITMGVSGVSVMPPVVMVQPTTIAEVLNYGDSIDVPINIANMGGSKLVWDANIGQWGKAMVLPEWRREPLVVKSPAVFIAPTHLIPSPPIDSVGDVLATWNLDVTVNENNLGVAYDGSFVWITNSGPLGSAGQNVLYKYDLSGNVIQIYPQPNTSPWGWKDLAFDGTFLYGSDSNVLDQIDPSTGQITGVTIPSPSSTNDALAYDPESDHFWTYQNMSQTLMEFDRSGNVINQYPDSLTITGLAWQPAEFGGPDVWSWSQDGTPPLMAQQLGTGQSFMGTDYTGFQVAGGADIATDFIAGKLVLLAIHQPDMLVVYDLDYSTQPPHIKLLPPFSGNILPGDNTDLMVRLFGITPSTIGDTLHPSVVINSNDPVTSQVEVQITLEVVKIGDPDEIPTSWAVDQNYPNPFNPTTTIKFQVPQAAPVKLNIYNVLGQHVKTLVNQKLQPGYYQAVWDGRNNNGRQVSSGIYVYRFEAEGYQQIMKMILMK